MYKLSQSCPPRLPISLNVIRGGWRGTKKREQLTKANNTTRKRNCDWFQSFSLLFSCLCWCSFIVVMRVLISGLAHTKIVSIHSGISCSAKLKSLLYKRQVVCILDVISSSRLENTCFNLWRMMIYSFIFNDTHFLYALYVKSRSVWNLWHM